MRIVHEINPAKEGGYNALKQKIRILIAEINAVTRKI